MLVATFYGWQFMLVNHSKKKVIIIVIKTLKNGLKLHTSQFLNFHSVPSGALSKHLLCLLLKFYLVTKPKPKHNFLQPTPDTYTQRTFINKQKQSANLHRPNAN